jgi:hypothetical protein
MSGVPINITGRRFSRLVALRLHHVTAKRGAYWTCQCDCGNTTVASLADLRDGGAKSCGCLWREAMRDIARNKATTKLTWVDVRRIQLARMWVVPPGGLPERKTQAELARQYGVSTPAISAALKAQVPPVQKKRGRPPKPHQRLPSESSRGPRLPCRARIPGRGGGPRKASSTTEPTVTAVPRPYL